MSRGVADGYHQGLDCRKRTSLGKRLLRFQEPKLPYRQNEPEEYAASAVSQLRRDRRSAIAVQVGEKGAVPQFIPRQSGCDERVNQDEKTRLDSGMIVAISNFCNA
jgi:hypothetical protein